MRICKVHGQLTVGKLIEELEKQKPDAYVNYDWEVASPDPADFGSYRGYYEDLALGAECKYGHEPKVQEILDALKSSIGKTFLGWKGGDYVCNASTPVWAASDGCTGYAITGVTTKYDGSWVLLTTAKDQD